MNFKRYHVSRNLFDKDNATLYTLYAGNGDIIRTSSNARSIAISCIEGETYTVSKKAGQRFMICFTTEPIATQVPYSGLVTDNTATSITARAPEGAKYLFVYFYNSTADTDTVETLVNSIMINTGSTALPYEPYSSEVWHDTPHYIHNTSTDTITTLPAVIHPTGTTATVGLKGNTTQSGTPTPDSPIMPQGTGERTGNLFDISTTEKGRIDDGNVGYTSATTALSVSSNKILFTINAKFRGVCGGFIEIPQNTTEITMSGDFGGTGGIGKKFVFYDAQKTWLNADITVDINTFICTVTMPNNAKYVRLSFTGQNANTDYRITNLMLNLGSTALPYEPYGYKLDILSANTTTPVYLGEVQTTRRIRKLVFDGSESWNRSTSGNNTRVYTPQIPECMSLSPAICTHFDYNVANVGYPRIGEFVINSSKAIIFGVDGNTFADVGAWKSYLAQQYANGTPVTVWYVLATPETGIVNEPLMKIGEYADEVSGITIPTIAGANTLSVGTTLQPSEVMVNYKGWHPVADVHERDNGAWT